MKVAVYQFAPIWGNIPTNLENISRVVASRKADLWILPELATTGYVFNELREVQKLAEDLKKGHTTATLRELTHQHQTAIVLGLAEKYGDRIFNSAVVFNRGELCAIYRKAHLFYEEKKWFIPGVEPPPLVDIQGVKVGVMICYDWLFPEMARTLALRGAQLIAHPANLVLPHCQNAMLTRSLENRVFTATANRIGSEGIGKKKLTFTGWSQITAPDGKRLGRLSRDRDGILIKTIDPKLALDKSLTSLNDIFADRHPEIYRLGE